MFNHQATPDRPLGVSVGATYLAATRDGHAAVIRPSELTLHGQRLTGFVDRIGDPVPLIASDGSAHRPEQLLAEALRTLTQSAEDITVAVPAHWRPSVVDSLRHALGGDVQVVSDATAALAALNADPGLPTRGVVVLCDFGGSGTNITLVNASSGHAVVGETVRFADLSGDLVDQALMTQVMTSLPGDADPSGTAVVGSLARLRDECRAAKERLSAHTATAVSVALPGHHADLRVTRAELEGLIRRPVTDFLAAVDETLERYGVPAAAVSAVATVGGGARIPLLTQKLSEHLRVPVVTTAQPQLAAAVGTALIAQRRRVADPETTLAPAGVEEATVRVDAGPSSGTFGALAWSEDDEEDASPPFTDSRPVLHFEHEQWQDEATPRRSPLVLFSLAAAAAVVTTALFGVTQLRGDTATPVEAATVLTPAATPPSTPAAPAPTPVPPAPQAPRLTTVVVQPAQRSSTPQHRSRRPAQAPQMAPAAPPWTPTPPTSAHPSPEPETPPSNPEPPANPEPPTDPQTPPVSDPPPIDPGPGNGAPSPDGDPVDPGSSDEQTGTDTVPAESSPTDGA
ncbi:Hsp70 family protein [Mycolicibacterium sp. XJ1904]